MPGGSRHADARTDVFQLGKVFYQMMTKRSPAVIDPAALPPGLAHIVTRATAARPADRYADVLALLQAVEGYENSERDRDSPRSILEHLTQRIDKLAEAGVPGEASGQAILEALAGLDWVQEDDFLEGFDRVPVNVLASLAHDNPTRLFMLLSSYAQNLERAAAHRHFHYADLVARRMQAVFQLSRDPAIKAQALGALLIAAVVLNRYAAMAIFKRLLFQIQDAETALLVAELLRDHRDFFQEVAPGSTSSGCIQSSVA